MDIVNMREHHISDSQMYQALGWLTMGELVMKLSLQWLGHVGRMPLERVPKQAMFGWIDHGGASGSIRGVTQVSWFRKTLGAAGIEEIDWLRTAVNRKEWKKRVEKAFPAVKLTREEARKIDGWRPGDELPQKRRIEHRSWENEEGQVSEQEDEESESEEEQKYKCPVCNKAFEAGNQLQYHYNEKHAIRDPSLVTALGHQCAVCKQFFGKQVRYHMPECPARMQNRKRLRLELGGWLPVEMGPMGRPPDMWWVATDGSGTTKVKNRQAVNAAGRGWSFSTNGKIRS